MQQAQKTSRRKGLVESLIKEHVEDERSWALDLNRVLFDYYSQLANYFDALMEICVNPSSRNPSSGEEELTVTGKQATILKSLVSIMKILDAELCDRHNISLTLH